PLSILLHSHLHLPSLHSFPTRRSSDLFSHQSSDLGRRSNESDSASLADFRKVGVLRQQPIPRMNCLYIGDFRGTDHSRNIQITLDRKSTRLNSSHVKISYAVFCLKKKK